MLYRPCSATQKASDSRSTHSDYYSGLNDVQFDVKPLGAGLSLSNSRLSIAGGETLNHVSNTDRFTRDTALEQQGIKILTSLTYKGSPLKVFILTRILSDQHHTTGLDILAWNGTSTPCS